MTWNIPGAPWSYLILGAYFASLLVLSGYGLHRWLLLFLYFRHRRAARAPARQFATLPRLTVQIPLYNELYVVRRVVEAVCRLDYPRDRLQIQVLDDSTDDTRDLVAEVVAEQRAAGVDIEHVHRSVRRGYKAGALADGMASATGELIAVFDADFMPKPDFALRLVHYFTDPRVGMVQARWGHLNRNHSFFTRAQALLLDGHFVIEHTARNRSGRFFNFNGTAGIWRRTCIEEAGGWAHDTLAEDVDLSYRAQLRGWQFVFVPEVIAPAELPLEMSAFKAQQHRWAKGAIQAARKLLPTILASAVPGRVKLEAFFHLTANIGYVLVLLLALLMVPAVYLRAGVSPWLIVAVDLPIFLFSVGSVAVFYVVAYREVLGTRRGVWRIVPFLMAVGIGLCINNARAVLEALAGHASEFKRTPKYNLCPGEGLQARRYRGQVNSDTIVELAMAIYFTGGLVTAAVVGIWGALPFLLLFGVGFGYTALSTVLQSPRGRLAPTSR